MNVFLGLDAGGTRTRAALMLPLLEHPDPTVAEMAYSEFAAAPCAAP